MLFLNENRASLKAAYYSTASTSANHKENVEGSCFEEAEAQQQFSTPVTPFSTASVVAAAVAAVSLSDDCSASNFDYFLNKSKFF